MKSKLFTLLIILSVFVGCYQETNELMKASDESIGERDSNNEVLIIPDKDPQVDDVNVVTNLEDDGSEKEAILDESSMSAISDPIINPSMNNILGNTMGNIMHGGNVILEGSVIYFNIYEDMIHPDGLWATNKDFSEAHHLTDENMLYMNTTGKYIYYVSNDVLSEGYMNIKRMHLESKVTETIIVGQYSNLILYDDVMYFIDRVENSINCTNLIGDNSRVLVPNGVTTFQISSGRLVYSLRDSDDYDKLILCHLNPISKSLEKNVEIASGIRQYILTSDNLFYTSDEAMYNMDLNLPLIEELLIEEITDFNITKNGIIFLYQNDRLDLPPDRIPYANSINYIDFDEMSIKVLDKHYEEHSYLDSVIDDILFYYNHDGGNIDYYVMSAVNSEKSTRLVDILN